MDNSENEYRVLIGAPKEAREIGQILEENGFATLLCEDAASLGSEIEKGAGAVIVSETLLMPGDGFRRLLEAISDQVEWSDLPLLVLIAADEPAPPPAWREVFAHAILFPLPVRRYTLVSAVGAALRSRRLQYRVREERSRRREAGEKIQWAQTTLEEQIDSRTRELRETSAKLIESRALAETHRDIAYMANTAGSVEEALNFCLDRVVRLNRWDFGHAWFPSRTDSEVLEIAAEHYAIDPARSEPIRKASRELKLKRGRDLPGRVLASGESRWTHDISDDLETRSQVADSLGIQTAAAFPILVESRVVGVFEFFSGQRLEFDPQIEESMASIGMQMGRVIERDEAQSNLSERESRLRQLTEHLRDVVWLRDAETSAILYCNPAFETVFGQPRKLLERGPEARLELVHEDDRDRLAQALERLHSGEAFDETVRILKPDGSHCWIRERGHPICDARGRVVRFLHAVEDITTRREAEEVISLLDQRISEAAEEERRRIARDLHDSLGGLLSATDLRQQILVDAIAEGRMPRLEDAELVSKMIREGVAETRRLTHGLQPIGDNPDDLMDALGSLASTVRTHAAMDCQCLCPEPVPVPDSRMANELFRIAQEAANNAVKHSDARNLTLELFRHDGFIALKVVDDGSGIDLRNSSDVPGGLGLEIMKHRARSIGGSLEIESGTDGTTVACAVPIHEGGDAG